jgi:CTP synthase
VRQLRTEYGASNIIFVHLAYIPYLLASKELKTKPTQNSVKDLRMRGIIPDMLILRADYDIPDDIRRKVSLMCGVKHDHVIPLPTLDSIYLVPEHLNSHSV